MRFKRRSPTKTSATRAHHTLEPMTALEQLGAFVATHQPDQRARAEVRLHTADTIGAWIAACGTAEGRALLAFRLPFARATCWIEPTIAV